MTCLPLFCTTFQLRLTSDFLLFLTHLPPLSIQIQVEKEWQFQNIIATSMFESLMSQWNFQADNEVIIWHKTSIAPQNWLSCRQELNTIREHKIMLCSKLINMGKKSQTKYETMQFKSAYSLITETINYPQNIWTWKNRLQHF